jgi:hypothetical protein
MSLRLLAVLALSLPLAGVAAEPDKLATYSGPKEKLQIYVLVGQSNMSGRAKVEDEDRAIPKRLFLLDDKGKWVRATHPFIRYTNVTNGPDVHVIKEKGKIGLSLGLTFARRMLEADPGVSLGLVINSQGGSAIESWKKGAKNSNYDKTLERVRPILGSGVVKGVLWHQGEANVRLGEKYLDLLADVIGQFRQDLGDAQLPFVAGQIAPLVRDKDKEKIQDFNRFLLDLPSRVRHTAVAPTTGFSGADVHFDSPETRELGRRYAEQMLKLQGSTKR